MRLFCRWKILIPAICFLIVVFLFLSKIKHFADQEYNEQYPLLLWWKPFNLPHSQSITLHQCGTATCAVTSNRLYLSQAKMIMFYGSSLEEIDLPLPRLKHHMWALLHEESPRNNPVLLHDAMLQHFNFSSTFSRHSDFPLYYSLPSMEELTGSEHCLSVEEKSARRKQLAPVLYMQSDCLTMTARDEYVKQLMEYIPVDSYGACLHNSDLPKSLTEDYLNKLYDPEILSFVGQYKFVLAIENAVCDDYVTEKFWRPLIAGTIPIYEGATTVRDYQPNNHSVIYLSDFDSPKALASYLLKLDANDMEYNKYLKHKFDKKEGITNPYLQEALKKKQNFDGIFHDFECNLCKKLEAIQPDMTHMVTKAHYNCPLPCKDFFYNSIHSQGKCQANILNELLQKNKNFTADLYNKLLSERVSNEKCLEYVEIYTMWKMRNK